MTVAVPEPRSLTQAEQQTAQDLLSRSRAAMRAIEDLDQAAVDRLCRAVAWAGGNETTATRLAQMSVAESGMGSPEPKRAPRSSVSSGMRSVRRASASS